MNADTLFVDRGGVLVDNTRLAGQWRRLLGDFFPPRLGATAAAWAGANTVALERQFARFDAAVGAGGPARGVTDWFAADGRNWLYDMCDVIGLERPAPARADALAREAVAYVKANLEFEAPRTLGRLRGLRARGLTLHVASGDPAPDLELYLRKIGARDLFDHVYGADLLGTWKAGPAYYRAILERTGADPRRTWVLDDSPRAIEWAAACGLRGFLVRHTAEDELDVAVQLTLDVIEAALDGTDT